MIYIKVFNLSSLRDSVTLEDNEISKDEKGILFTIRELLRVEKHRKIVGWIVHEKDVDIEKEVFIPFLVNSLFIDVIVKIDL